jgi:hypothetical protein
LVNFLNLLNDSALVLESAEKELLVQLSEDELKSLSEASPLKEWYNANLSKLSGSKSNAAFENLELDTRSRNLEVRLQR